MPGRHAAQLTVLVGNVDEAQVGKDWHGDLGEPYDHLVVLGNLGQHLGGQQEELVAAPGLEQFVDQMFALGGQGRRVQ